MELRLKKGLTLEQLGERIGLTKSQASRIEKGKTKLTVEMAFKIAEALEASVTEVIGLAEAVRPDVVEAKPRPGSDLALLAGRPNRLVYEVQTSVLDEKRIVPGGFIVVEKLVKPGAEPKSLSMAVLTLHDHDDPSKFITIIRQFVPPNLFVTNSRDENWPPINRTHENLCIVGVILFPHTPL